MLFESAFTVIAELFLELSSYDIITKSSRRLDSTLFNIVRAPQCSTNEATIELFTKTKPKQFLRTVQVCSGHVRPISEHSTSQSVGVNSFTLSLIAASLQNSGCPDK